MKRLLSGSLCAFLSFAFLPWAWGEGGAPTPLEPVVVTATRTEVPIGQVGSSVTVITQEEIRQQQASTVLEVLRNVPGLDVVRTGSAGGTTSAFLRGANSGHTLVLIDGVQLNSPTTGLGELANLTVDNIERIEVVRGPQSTLYGSDAIGGVIQIITKQGRGRPQLSLFGEGGTYKTNRTGLSFRGGGEQLSLSSSLSRDRSGGIRPNSDYQNTTFSAHLTVEPLEKSSFHLISRYTGSKLDVPGSRFFPNPRSKQKADSWAITGKWDQVLTDWWDWQFQLSFFDSDLEWQDPKFRSSARIDTQTITADLRTNFYLGPYSLLTLGGEWERQEGINSGAFDDRVISRAFYAQNQFNWENRLFLTLGYRVDDHSSFGSHNNGRVALAYLVNKTGTRLRGSWGGGFKAPSLNSLVFPGFGNKDLRAEESEGFDVGIEQALFGGRLRLGATYFWNEFKDLILFVPTREAAFPFGLKPENVGIARTQGVELEGSLWLGGGLTLKAAYTHLRARDEETGRKLLRRPDDRFGFNLNYRLADRLNVNLDSTVVKRRPDLGGSNAGYTKWDLAVTYDLVGPSREGASARRLKLIPLTKKLLGALSHLQLYGRAENLFDDDYEEALGFPAPGVLFLTGVQATF